MLFSIPLRHIRAVVFGFGPTIVHPLNVGQLQVSLLLVILILMVIKPGGIVVG